MSWQALVTPGDRSEARGAAKRQRARHGVVPAFNWPAYLIAAFLAAAILFGGGGAEGPANNGVIYAASALLLLGLAAAHWQGIRPLGEEAVLPVWLLAGFLLIGAIQLVPLPPAVWRELPGRDLAESALALIPAGDRWRPLSLDPEATRRSMAALLLPGAIMIAVLGGTGRETLLLVRTIIACALLSSVIGILQITLGYPDVLTYYEGGNVGAASGVFANANHQAALLLAAIVCLGLAVRLRRRDDSGRDRARKVDPIWLLLPFFAVMTLASESRAGALLLVLAVPASLAVGLGRTSPRLWIGALAGVALVGVLVTMLSPGANGLALGSFLSDEKRAVLLPDVLFTLRQYWPWGSGFGTFVPAFAVNENLDLAGREFINHAHNDVLELVIEAGIAGAILLAVAAVAVGYRAVAAQSSRGTEEGQGATTWTGLFILALFGLHSLVDYPLRTPSIAAVAGAAVGLVFLRTKDRAPTSARVKLRPRWVFAIGAVVALVLSAQVLRMFVAQAAVRAGDGAASMRVRPQNGAGLALAAEEELVRRRNAGARALAHRAIDQSPFSARAVRVLATAEDLDRRGGMQAWRVASAMGWRDAPTQYWAMQQALANGEFETAAIRADAFLRTAGEGLRNRIEIVRALAARDLFRAQLVRRLMLDPPWKPAFFNVSATTPDQQLQGVLLVLRDLSSSPSRPTVRDAGSIIRALIERKQYATAIALHQAVAGPRVAGAAMKDLRFDRSTDHYANETNPFAWSFRSKGGSVTSVEQSGSTRVLVVGTDGRDRHQPVRRYTTLAPGAYRLGYAMRGAAGSPEALGIAVYCAGSRQPVATSATAPLSTSGFERRQLVFAVPQSCPLLLLAFEAKESDRPTQAEFAGLSLQPL